MRFVIDDSGGLGPTRDRAQDWIQFHWAANTHHRSCNCSNTLCPGIRIETMIMCPWKNCQCTSGTQGDNFNLSKKTTFYILWLSSHKSTNIPGWVSHSLTPICNLPKKRTGQRFLSEVRYVSCRWWTHGVQNLPIDSYSVFHKCHDNISKLYTHAS